MGYNQAALKEQPLVPKNIEDISKIEDKPLNDQKNYLDNDRLLQIILEIKKMQRHPEKNKL